ncbi:MAG: hypothetical protein IT290_06630 [Deltaproteobacteria bacterium]|nr:hypothetical protein [Deltaproteobacteria bacterium]
MKRLRHRSDVEQHELFIHFEELFLSERRNLRHSSSTLERTIRQRVVELAREPNGQTGYLSHLLLLSEIWRGQGRRAKAQRLIALVLNRICAPDGASERDDRHSRKRFLLALAQTAEQIHSFGLAEECYLLAVDQSALAQATDPLTSLALLKHVSTFYFRRGQHGEALVFAQRALNLVHAGSVSRAHRVEIFAFVGSLFGAVGKVQEGLTYLISALTMSRTEQCFSETLRADIADRIAEIWETAGNQAGVLHYSRVSRAMRLAGTNDRR